MPTKARLGAPRILLASPDRDQAAFARDWLAEAGTAEVLLVDGLAETTIAMRESRWDLIVTDIRLPDASGLDLLKAAKSADTWVSVLLLSTADDPRLMRDALFGGAQGWLLKPLDKAEFVSRALELARDAIARRPSQRKRVLAIGAHPDDVEIGCGGALLKHRAVGDELMVLTLSAGANGGDPTLRLHEARVAADMLDARLTVCGLRDGQISEGLTTIQIIETAIRDFQPTHIYTHSNKDSHQDHRNVHHASVVAAREVSTVLCYQSPSSTVDFRPNLFIDVSKYIDAKLELISAHESQTKRRPNLASDLILATARYWGRFAGHILAEPMILKRGGDVP